MNVPDYSNYFNLHPDQDGRYGKYGGSYIPPDLEKIMAEIPDDGPAPAAGTGGLFSETDLERVKKQAAEEAARKEREKVVAEFAEKERKGLQDRRRAEISSWCGNMVAQGRLTPALVDFGLPEMLAAFAERDEAIEFGEAKQKATLYDRFKALFEKELPKLVEFGEIARRDRDVGGKTAGGQLAALTKKKMEDNKSKELINGWRKALSRAKSWVEPEK